MTGRVPILHGGAITRLSKRQPTVEASTTEADYISATHAVKEALRLRVLLADLGIMVTTFQIKGDNCLVKHSALKLLKNPVPNPCARSTSMLSNTSQGSVWQGERWSSAMSLQTSYVHQACTWLRAADKLWRHWSGTKVSTSLRGNVQDIGNISVILAKT